MREKEEIWEEINSFVNEYFTDAYGIMVTGSFVTEYFNETSDIDIIILSGLFRKIFIDTYNYHGIKMQAIIFPVFDLETVLRMDIENGGVYLHQIQKGIIIKDKKNIFNDFKTYADSIYAHGPGDITKYGLDIARARITTRLEDLEGNNDKGDNLFTLLDLYPKVLDLYFKANGKWAFSGKSASRFLKETDLKFYNKFTSSIMSYLKYGEKNKAITFLKEFLKNVGGEMHYFTTREYTRIEFSNSLVVFISTNYSGAMNTTLKTIAQKAKNYICQHVNGVEMFSYYYPDRRVYKSGLYLIFFADKDKINEEVLPLVEAFHINLNNSQYRGLCKNFYYPYSNNPLDVFGDTVIQRKIANLINRIRNEHYTNKEQYVFHILLHILRISFFKDKNVRYAFLKLCYNILDITDNSLYITAKANEYYSQNAIENYEHQYTEFKTKISKDHFFNLKWITSSVNELFTIYDKNIKYTTKFSIEALSDDPYLKGNISFCIFLVNLIEVILNSFYHYKSNKQFIVFAALKYISQ